MGANERQLSDTLLSILANRGGDMVNAIFGQKGKRGFEERLGYEMHAQ